MPACRPLVHTLVAMKVRAGVGAAARRSRRLARPRQRAVEHLAAGIAQRADGLGQRRELRAIGADVEAHIGAARDNWQRFASMGSDVSARCSFTTRVCAPASVSASGGSAQAGSHVGGKPQESPRATGLGKHAPRS